MYIKEFPPLYPLIFELFQLGGRGVIIYLFYKIYYAYYEPTSP